MPSWCDIIVTLDEMGKWQERCSREVKLFFARYHRSNVIEAGDETGNSFVPAFGVELTATADTINVGKIDSSS